jgi:hypothetical protein
VLISAADDLYGSMTAARYSSEHNPPREVRGLSQTAGPTWLEGQERESNAEVVALLALNRVLLPWLYDLAGSFVMGMTPEVKSEAEWCNQHKGGMGDWRALLPSHAIFLDAFLLPDLQALEDDGSAQSCVMSGPGCYGCVIN